ncbi:hypothetical protein [Carboxylicivirga sediminis]|uniref:hypothetical protein n=1 Tax=Carboxylicivirga sediminis TaxID=2006564 RepID=UPI001BA9E96B|nr:hypothetical protein [Carboxylicivirga sediminis]
MSSGGWEVRRIDIRLLQFITLLENRQMFFEQRPYHRIVAFLCIAIHLIGCSGNRWVTSYNKSVELEGDYTVFINQNYRNYYHQLYGAVTSDSALLGYIIPDEEINTVPRQLDYYVVYCDMQLADAAADSLSVAISFDAIIKVRQFEYNKNVKYARTAVLVALPFVLAIIIYHEYQSMNLDVGWSG